MLVGSEFPFSDRFAIIHRELDSLVAAELDEIRKTPIVYVVINWDESFIPAQFFVVWLFSLELVRVSWVITLFRAEMLRATVKYRFISLRTFLRLFPFLVLRNSRVNTKLHAKRSQNWLCVCVRVTKNVFLIQMQFWTHYNAKDKHKVRLVPDSFWFV